MDEQRVIDKIRKLLAKADKSRNDNEAEAQSAALMAQKLMAQYDLAIEDVSDIAKKEPIGYMATETKWNAAFRFPLANIIANNFRCRAVLDRKVIMFIGHKNDCLIAKEVFEYLYQFVLSEGNRQYNLAYARAGKTKGVFNSYALGFIRGLEQKLSEQCKALALVVPTEVDEALNSPDIGTRNTKLKTDRLDTAAYDNGMNDGLTIMNSKGRISG